MSPRLCAATLPRLPDGIGRPLYARAGLAAATGHIGAGAFHRCHQAEYLDDLLNTGAAAGGIVAVNLRPPLLGDLLAPQDGLYTRTLCEGGSRDHRVIGSILAVHDAARDAPGAVAALAAAAVTTITMTVTEKGYCHIPATGDLDHDHADVRADLGAPRDAPRSLPGFLFAVLRARAASGSGAGAVNLVSCDNIASNGQVLRAVLRGFAAAADPSFLPWIDDHAAFPATMVDRIVPATTPEDIAAATAATGLRDAAPVSGERFRQWVIEDAMRAPRPAWEMAGADIVRDAAPYELTKMRVLNGAQTLCALYGALAGHEFTWQAAADPAISASVGATLRAETLPHLPDAPGIDAASYLAQSFARIGNTAIRHRCHQIATDTSQKINQRLLAPIRARRAAGLPHSGLTRGVAAWIALLARSGRAFGARWPVSDPVMGRVTPMLEKAGRDLSAIVAGVIGMEDVFGTELARDAGFRAAVARALTDLMEDRGRAGRAAMV